MEDPARGSLLVRLISPTTDCVASSVSGIWEPSQSEGDTTQVVGTRELTAVCEGWIITDAGGRPLLPHLPCKQEVMKSWVLRKRRSRVLMAIRRSQQ